MQDFAVLADIVGPTIRHPTGIEAAESVGEFFAGVAQDWVIQVQTFSEVSVFLDVVDAGGEVGNIEFTNEFAALTERLAFFRSATGERFGIPRNYKSFFPFELLRGIGFSIAADQCKIGHLVSNRSFCICHSASKS